MQPYLLDILDIFIVVNRYLIDSIEKYSMIPFNWIN